MEREKTEVISAEQARKEIAGGDMQAVDSRSQEDWLEAHVPGSVQAPEGEVPVDEIRTKVVLAIADGDEAEADLCASLQESGFEVKTLEGGFAAWKKGDMTIQPSHDPEPEAPVDPDDGGSERSDAEGAAQG